MSIYVEIQNRVNEGRLIDLPPLYGTSQRRMLISSEIDALLNGTWISDEWDERRMGLRADLDFFTEGNLVNVALPNPARPYANKSDALLRLLHPGAKEVWEIRSRHSDSNLSIRIFGKFAAIDTFIALGWAKRRHLAEPQSRQWRDARVSCGTEWTKLFPSYQPQTGGALHDYISKNCVLV